MWFSDLPQINLFITTARSNNRFTGMEDTHWLNQCGQGTYTRCVSKLTLLQSGDQLHFNKFFSKLCWCPSITFTHRFCGAYGRISHMQSLQSIPFVRRYERPSGLNCMPVIISWWPWKCHCNFTFVQVPYQYFIVNTTCEDLIRCLRETDCCNLVFI